MLKVSQEAVVVLMQTMVLVVVVVLLVTMVQVLMLSMDVAVHNQLVELLGVLN
jgi:hypothetical protein